MQRCSTTNLGGVPLFTIHSYSIGCPHQSIVMFQRMMIWKCPSRTSLFHHQSWSVHLFDIHSNASVCPYRSIAMFQKMMIWRCPSSTSLFSQLLSGSLDHGLSLNNIAPSMIWMCSFIDYLSLNTIVFSSLIHHLIIFHCLIVDLNIACFSFSGSTVLPPSCSTFQGVSRSVNVIYIKDFTYSIDVLLCSIIFLVLESNLAFQKLCLFKSNCWNEIREMLILKRSFEKSSLLVQDPTHVIQNIQSFDCHVFW